MKSSEFGKFLGYIISSLANETDKINFAKLKKSIEMVENGNKQITAKLGEKKSKILL